MSNHDETYVELTEEILHFIRYGNTDHLRKILDIVKHVPDMFTGHELFTELAMHLSLLDLTVKNQDIVKETLIVISYQFDQYDFPITHFIIALENFLKSDGILHFVEIVVSLVVCDNFLVSLEDDFGLFCSLVFDKIDQFKEYDIKTIFLNLMTDITDAYNATHLWLAFFDYSDAPCFFQELFSHSRLLDLRLDNLDEVILDERLYILMQMIKPFENVNDSMYVFEIGKTLAKICIRDGIDCNAIIAITSELHPNTFPIHLINNIPNSIEDWRFVIEILANKDVDPKTTVFGLTSFILAITEIYNNCDLQNYIHEILESNMILFEKIDEMCNYIVISDNQRRKLLDSLDRFDEMLDNDYIPMSKLLRNLECHFSVDNSPPKETEHYSSGLGIDDVVMLEVRISKADLGLDRSMKKEWQK